jgi:cation transport ATPase
MAENHDNRGLDDEEAERERVRTEMWASVKKMSEEYGPEGVERAVNKFQEEAQRRADERNEESKKKLIIWLIALVVLAVAMTAIFKGHFIAGFIIAFISGLIVHLSQSPEERAETFNQTAYGYLNTSMICPHCNTKGQIRTMTVTNKKGISGGKATAAVITGGWSVLATGLSRKENQTQAHCMSCKNTWTF